MSAIQSLKAVDAWIDVINANINGGVRTAYKSSRLKFAGSNVEIERAGTTSALPLQFPEAGLTAASTTIDWTQGAITTSTEDTHIAIQGKGFFKLARLSDDILDPATQFYYSRDGEFRWQAIGPAGSYNMPGSGPGVPYNPGPGTVRYMLVNSQGLGVIARHTGQWVVTRFNTGTGAFDYPSYLNPGLFTGTPNTGFVDDVGVFDVQDRGQLTMSRYGATVFAAPTGADTVVSSADMNKLSKSLEASNASMTQSVPELSLAQKLFSALTKVLQTKQTNVDSVLNTIR